MNGVTHSVLKVLEHLERRGDAALVVAPGADGVPERVHGARIAPVPSIAMPAYPEVRLAMPTTARLAAIVEGFRPDVLHLASPFLLGWKALAVAERLGVPSVAVYQTDVPAFAERYGFGGAASAAAAHLARLHRRATVTLAPSSAAAAELVRLGVDEPLRWGRGVDTRRFDPAHRSERWRRAIAPGGEALVGYLGRLAPEKQLGDLARLQALPGARLVVIGDGPERARLERMLPDAVFTGFLGGAELGVALASLDVFVHPGESETFCQTVQEAHASGVPVVATGSGGPVDLVRSSIDGWLYRPGDLDELEARVRDLVGDAAKRAAFGAAGRGAVAARSWERLGEELVGHYRTAVARHRTGGVAPARAPGTARRRFVALGDSITEGLCDDSRMPAGSFRGWADRLAMLLAQSGGAGEGMRYANLAVRSRRIADVVDEQIPAAIALGADLAAVLVGANDLVRAGARPALLARRLGEGLERLRASGCEVLVVTPFHPRRRLVRLALGERFDAFNAELAPLAESMGAHVLDARRLAWLGASGAWADDRVHLSASGHRALAYAAARVLGVPDAGALAGLDAALHDDDGEEAAPRSSTAVWLRRHAAPWALRRLAGRTAGDGRAPKHDRLVPVLPPGDDARRRSSRPEPIL